MEVKLQKYLKENKYEYIKINDLSTLTNIYNYYFNQLYQKFGTGEELYYYGLYCEIHIYYLKTKDYYTEIMLRYYNMSIQQNNDNAMYRMGEYYYREKEYSLARKYFLMAVEYNNTYAMWGLGIYYYHLQLYADSIKYLMMGITNVRCVICLNKVLHDIREDEPYAYSVYANCANYLNEGNHNYYKKMVQKYVFQMINKITVDKIKFKPNNMGGRLSNIHFQIKITSAKDTYNKLDPDLVCYLGIKDKDDMVTKIEEYLC